MSGTGAAFTELIESCADESGLTSKQIVVNTAENLESVLFVDHVHHTSHWLFIAGMD